MTAPPLKTGDWLDVVDSDGIWNVAQVLRLPSADSVEVQYDCWGDEYDEVLRRDSPRIAPYRTYTWAVKCWAKLGSWPWWPALVTIRTPGSTQGAVNLSLEERLLVDFLDKESFEGRSRCWVKTESIVPLHYSATARDIHSQQNQKKKAKKNAHPSGRTPTQRNFELSESLLKQCDAREKFPAFSAGTLPAKYADTPTPPCKELRLQHGEKFWRRAFANNRHRHAATHAYPYKRNAPIGDNADKEKKTTLTISTSENGTTELTHKSETRHDDDSSSNNPRKTRGASQSPRTPLSQCKSARKISGIDPEWTRTKEALDLTDVSSVPRHKDALTSRKSPKRADGNISNDTSSEQKSAAKDATKRHVRKSPRTRKSSSSSGSDLSVVTRTRKRSKDAQILEDGKTTTSPTLKLPAASASTNAAHEPRSMHKHRKRGVENIQQIQDDEHERQSKRLKKLQVEAKGMTAKDSAGIGDTSMQTVRELGAIGGSELGDIIGLDKSMRPTPALLPVRKTDEKTKVFVRSRRHRPVSEVAEVAEESELESPGMNRMQNKMADTSTPSDQDLSSKHNESSFTAKHMGAASTNNDAEKQPTKAKENAVPANQEPQYAPRKYGKTPKALKGFQRASGHLPLYVSPYLSRESPSKVSTNDTLHEVHGKVKKSGTRRVRAGHKAALRGNVREKSLQIAPRAGASAGVYPKETNASTSTRPMNTGRVSVRKARRSSSSRTHEKPAYPMEYLSSLTQKVLQTGGDLHALETALEDKINEFVRKSSIADELRKKSGIDASNTRPHGHDEIALSSESNLSTRFVAENSQMAGSESIANLPRSVAESEAVRRSSLDVQFLEQALEAKIDEFARSARLGRSRVDVDRSSIKAAVMSSADVQAVIMRIQRPGHVGIESNEQSSSLSSANSHFLFEGTTFSRATTPLRSSRPTPKLSPRTSTLRWGRLSGDNADTARVGPFGTSTWSNAESTSLLDVSSDYRKFTFSLSDNFSMEQWYRDIYPQPPRPH